ncbi:hypothetical protein [Reyranella sp.]|uniref:hypothetical protein n=1 Tax=Reyranella sp. TaxID=1929291 RepID=UPI003D113455
MIRTAVFKASGHAAGGPSGVAAQSQARINPASSLRPRKSWSLSTDAFPDPLSAIQIIPPGPDTFKRRAME